MTTEWPFHETYRVDLPPTQVKSAVERCKKKNIVDLAAPSEETQNIIQAVFAAYSKKKERARAASSKSRAAKGAAEEPAIDIEVEVANEPSAGICEVVAEAEQAPEPEAAPEPAAPPKAAPRAAKSRADNVAPEAVPKKPVEAPAPAPAPQKRAAAEAPAPRRRGGGLCGMVAEVSLNA